MPDIAQIQSSHESNMSTLKLPIIDVSPYLDPNSTLEARQQASTSLDKACREFGFFYVTGHGLDITYLQSLLKLGHEFFQLPQETKDQIHIFKSQDGVRGYQKIGENVTYAKRDQQEALDIYPEPSSPSSEKLEGSQLWPSEEDMPEFKKTMLEYTEKMSGRTFSYGGLETDSRLKIGKAFMRMMGDVLGEQEIFEELQKDNYWVLRVIGYPPLPPTFDTSKGISCGAHTDYGCLTFLLADDFPGALQVEARDGSWIPADPVPGAFVVNIGDIIDSLTSHAYRSTYHRVIHRGNKYRVSIPFFFEPPRDMTISPIPKMATVDAVKPFVYFDHLKSMIYRHFVANDQELPEAPNANELTSRG